MGLELELKLDLELEPELELELEWNQLKFNKTKPNRMKLDFTKPNLAYQQTLPNIRLEMDPGFELELKFEL